MTAELFRDLTGRAVARFSVGGDWSDRQVSVVGAFNDWTPGVDVLQARGDGTRSTVVAVDDGRDVWFRYLATGDDWFDDPDADTVTEHGSVLRWPGGGAAGTTNDGAPPAPTEVVERVESAERKAAGRTRVKKASTKKASTKKATTKKSPTKKAPAKRAPAQEASTPQTPSAKAADQPKRTPKSGGRATR